MKTLQKAKTDYAQEYRQKLRAPQDAAASAWRGASVISLWRAR